MTENYNPKKNTILDTTNTTLTTDQKPSGINKHLYSSVTGSNIGGENIYADNKSSVNKEESYQTLDNRTVPTKTMEKVNPFNVKGVPGCKECGGSGWKESAKNPHPCNECAKLTVPVIDTYMTKIGQTATPVISERVEIEHITSTEPIKGNVKESYKEHITTGPITTTTEHVQVSYKEPITTTTITTTPITGNVKESYKEHITSTRPITTTTENVQVSYKEPITTIPITGNVQVSYKEPITTTQTTTTQTTTTPITENVQVSYKEPIVKEVVTTKSTEFEGTKLH